MARFKFKSVISAGFVTILTLIFIVITLWIFDVKRNKEKILSVINQQVQTNLISIMRDVTLERAISLHRMADMEDPFDRDEEFIRFREIAEKFLKSQGYNIARRTVAKYREQMNIPVARLRKEL